jgi:hypothetical protein
MHQSARLIYGTNSDKPPAPILVKKLLLMMIAAGILECQHVSVSANDDGAFDEYNLALGLATIGPDGTALCLHNNSFWQNPPLIGRIGLKPVDPAIASTIGSRRNLNNTLSFSFATFIFFFDSLCWTRD